MAGRMRGRRRTRRPAAFQKQRAPSKYFQQVNTLDLQSLASGGDASLTIVDNSGQILPTGNIAVKFNKITIQTSFDLDLGDSRDLLVAVIRHKEGTTPEKLDTVTDVRNLRNENQLLRGPWMIQTPAYDTSGVATPFDRFMKTIVLKNIVLDEDDDLVMGFTNLDSAFSANAERVRNMVRGFYREV